MRWPDRPGRMVRRVAERERPGSCLDLGCGDGKNLAYLERLGWTVDGIDISSCALDAARHRLATAQIGQRGTLLHRDVAEMRVEMTYDVVLAYGLFHCIDDRRLGRTAAMIAEAVRPNGRLIVATFNDEMPMPANHGTGSIFLRPRGTIFALFPKWIAEEVEYGSILEDHLPVIGAHEHSLTWAVLRKPCPI